MMRIRIQDKVFQESASTPLQALENLRKAGKLAGIPKGDLKSIVVAVLRTPEGEKLIDLSEELPADSEVELLGRWDPRALEVLRHSASHLLAMAVKSIWREAKLGIGPATERGFYYDIDTPEPINEEILKEIEEKMREIARMDVKFSRRAIPRTEAIELFKSLGEDYKVELLEEMEEEEVSIYENDLGDWKFIDLCRGPHVPSTGYIKHFKLLSFSGVYWRGIETNPTLQRIYGTAFFTEDELKEFLRLREEAKKRDHRVLGPQLGLFDIVDEVGPGLVLWHPKGAIVRRIIEDFLWNKLVKNGYQLLYTPHVARAKLWEISGHLEFYRENMFPIMEVEGQEYVVKPMNCPFHIMVYKSRVRSYKELPLRLAEFGTVYRYERSGVLHGLLRVRGFTQDDAHIFTTEEGMEEEIEKLIAFSKEILDVFGFKGYKVALSTRPEKYIGRLELWEKAERALENALKRSGFSYEVKPGEGAFYGPKIDIDIEDALGRVWQCTTIQLDFNLPERFDITYVGKDNQRHRPVMIHRALLGSMERFFGILIEHYAGAFPLWLAPVQVKVLSLSEKFVERAREVYQKLFEAGFRVELDDSDHKLGYKIRQAQLEKVPYMVIIGSKELETGLISVRHRREGDLGSMSLETFISILRAEVEEKTVK